MTTILNHANTASTVSPGYGAIPTITNGITTTIPNGAFLASTGSIGTTWTTSGVVSTPYDAALTIKGNDPATLEVKGNLVLNGQDLEERLKTIEKVLQIPERDVKLEKKYPKLKKLYDDYINALGKYRTFEAIKGD